MRTTLTALALPFLLAFGTGVSDRSTQLGNPFSVGAGTICGSCFDCMYMGTVGHNFQEAPLGLRQGLHAHSCYPEDCVSEFHPACDGNDSSAPALLPSTEEEKLRAAMRRAASGGLKEIVLLASEHPSRIRFNEQRLAIQVTGACSRDGIIAHFPVDAASFAIVRESVQL